jgi:hypothetical protein
MRSPALGVEERGAPESRAAKQLALGNGEMIVARFGLSCKCKCNCRS